MDNNRLKPEPQEPAAHRAAAGRAPARLRDNEPATYTSIKSDSII